MRIYLIMPLILLWGAFLFAENKYSNESEASTLVNGGNTKLKTYNAKTLNKYKFSKNILKLGGHYTYGETEETESINNWDLNFRYERELSEKLDAFLGETLEGNKFAGFDYRYSLDLGMSYNFIKTEKMKLKTELGYRYTIEKKVDIDGKEKDHKGRFFFKAESKHFKSFTPKFWFEYIRNIEESEDYQVSFEPSITVILTSIFSLKTAYKGVYDNTPAKEGNSKYYYSLITSRRMRHSRSGGSRPHLSCLGCKSGRICRTDASSKRARKSWKTADRKCGCMGDADDKNPSDSPV